jgi:hypothetical protein
MSGPVFIDDVAALAALVHRVHGSIMHETIGADDALALQGSAVVLGSLLHGYAAIGRREAYETIQRILSVREGTSLVERIRLRDRLASWQRILSRV